MVFPIAGAFAQSLEASLVAVSGGGADTLGWDLDWSLGEPSIGSYGTDSRIVAGFQQGYSDTVSAGSRIPERKAGVTLSRSGNRIRIRLPASPHEITVRVSDGNGRTYGIFTFLPGEDELTFPLDIRTGMAYVQVFENGKTLLGSFQVAAGKLK